MLNPACTTGFLVSKGIEKRMRTKKSNAIGELIEHWNAVSRTRLYVIKARLDIDVILPAFLPSETHQRRPRAGCNVLQWT